MLREEIFQTPLSSRSLCSICYELEMGVIERGVTKEVVKNDPYWQQMFNVEEDFCAFCGKYIRKDLSYVVEDNGNLKSERSEGNVLL